MASAASGSACVVDDRGREADLEGALGVNRVAEQEQLGRAPEPDHPRQEVGRSHVGSRQADLREEKGEAGGAREQT